MDAIDQMYRLADIGRAMAQVQRQAERISGHVLALEAAGMDLPKMKETATTLASIALGWAQPPADDPPEYDPYDDTADQAEDHAAAQRELAAIEAEEAHDAAGETWQAGAYPSGVTDPGETSGPKGLA